MTSENKFSKKLEKVIHLQRLYDGSCKCPLRVQERIYNKLKRSIVNLYPADEAEISEVWDFVCEKASVLGKITPLPGKDY